MYRVGDYVYFETSSTAPYQIRRIEELIKTQSGNVEAKVMCFYRRKDISSTLMTLADKHQSALDEEDDYELERDEDRHQLHHRELFLSRQVETLPATHIRGKCSVTLLNETEFRLSYLNKEDAFFYTLVYDPQQKTLLADRGEIRVGPKYQAEIPPLLIGEDERRLEDLETLAYDPNHGLSDRQIDQFLVICRSVGTFARALDCSSSVKQPSLHMSAAAASRDITLFHAMDLLHTHRYDVSSAIASLVPPSGPVLCRDEMEEWSASEANLFEEALEKYGKDFNDIRQDFLPWKSLKNIVEYYYMWKTTDRYVQQKRVKAVEAESKLKQVYIPNYNSKPATNGGTTENAVVSGHSCESCTGQTSSQWYAWGPPHLQCRLCHSCWSYWKKYGGLKYSSKLDNLLADNLELPPGTVGPERPHSSHRPHRCTIAGCGKEFKLKAHLARHCATVHGMAVRSGSPRPIMKTRAAFCLSTTPVTRLARRLCASGLRPRHAARNPFDPVDVIAVKLECHTKLLEGSVPLPKYKSRDRGKIVDISHRLGTPNLPKPEWLLPTPEGVLPKPVRIAFPPPPRGEDGRPIYTRIQKEPLATLNNCSQSILRKRMYEQNGCDGELGSAAKRRLMSSMMKSAAPDIYSLPRSTVVTPLNGRAKVATITRVGGRKQMISWVDAPDDVYFVATDPTRRFRRQLTVTELRRAARRPCRRANLRIPYYDVVCDVPKPQTQPLQLQQQPEPVVVLD